MFESGKLELIPGPLLTVSSVDSPVFTKSMALATKMGVRVGFETVSMTIAAFEVKTGINVSENAISSAFV